ncbi:nuclear transport factor 2 family protein [Clavibacter michiganensis]|uniref:Polyketide cyclase n=1 Tax=Clavibacter michiganensis subsp. insidiosus TaxID=33014 RepID=A0A0D5CIV6_9MICO|nr:nuclear transport factor 2 family protein [Clavibacter michiganensis]AJW79603.1 polyketide cyclase [Clavibacter michiganensis subsp. insidiosus]AWF97628.1 polyketide cyclase [Clavibacter michiganensis subsp. insidiosus]
MIYSRIVEAKVRSVFDRINAGDHMAMVDGLGDPSSYRFHGDHALGGRRSSRDAMIRWWRRVISVLPGVRFTIHDVIVRGGPGNTRIAVRATVTGPLPNGETYVNTVFPFMTLRWGAVTDVETVEDLQVLAHALDVVAASGDAEAAAAPISG